jgi:hypothetical protein
LVNKIAATGDIMTNHFFKYLTLAVSCFGLGCLSSWGEDKVVDVIMPSPFVPLPIELAPEKPEGGQPSCLVTDGRVRQESGPEAEVLTAYLRQEKKPIAWLVWARLPDVNGEFVFSKGSEKIRITVTEDQEHPHAHRVVVQGGATGAPETAQPILIQRAVLLPISGLVRQVSGPATTLLPDKAGAGKVWAKIPDQVCTLVFETEGKSDRVVVRVWAEKDNRCFVSVKKGDDANPGTEDKPFKTLHCAIKHMMAKTGKKGGIYMAGGEYDLGDDKLTVQYQISIFGGFDENGWRRDPIITAPVLLPHGFCENWINDISDRFKDLRRTEPRYHETIILRRTDKKLTTLEFGAGSSPGYLQCAGTPDTYVDGITIYGPDERSSSDATTSFGCSRQNKRSIRNCMILHFFGVQHDFMMNAPGDGRLENNLIGAAGIDPSENNDRPDIAGSFGRWHRNLILGGNGGAYCRIICIWGEGGVFTENQIHGGECIKWTGMQAHHSAMFGDRANTFRKNVMYLDFLFRPFWGAGLIMEENEIYLFQGGPDELMASKVLTIRNNHFHLAPNVRKEDLWPAKMTHKLGGKFVDGLPANYTEPEGEGIGKPIIENNEYSVMEKSDRRMGTLVDLKKLTAQGAKVGQSAYVRPKDSAKKLQAQATGNGAVSLVWEESADTDVVGYIVRYGLKSNSYLNPTVLGKVHSTEIKNLQPGEWYFTVVPYKEANVECWKLSNEAQVVVK